MKYFIFILIILAAVIFLATQFFTSQFYNANPQPLPTAPTVFVPPATSTLHPLPQNPTPTTFHGPVGQPHMVGPQSNPPNY